MNQSSNSSESGAPLRTDEAQVSPAIKAWLKNVLVPAMVKQYIDSHCVAVRSVPVAGVTKRFIQSSGERNRQPCNKPYEQISINQNAVLPGVSTENVQIRHQLARFIATGSPVSMSIRIVLYSRGKLAPRDRIKSGAETRRLGNPRVIRQTRRFLYTSCSTSSRVYSLSPSSSIAYFLERVKASCVLITVTKISHRRPKPLERNLFQGGSERYFG